MVGQEEQNVFEARNHAPSEGVFSHDSTEVRQTPAFFTSEHGERLRAERRESVRRLYVRGLVPLAIADALGWADARVARYLNELEDEGAIEPVPSYLSREGPRRGPRCQTCGR